MIVDPVQNEYDSDHSMDVGFKFENDEVTQNYLVCEVTDNG
jgi:hypothetical protein